jgi:hypothetical protein
MVNGWIQNQAQNPRTIYFLAVTDKRSDQLVGDAGLYVRSIRSRQGEIGGASFQVTRVRALRPKLARRYCASHLAVSACTEFLRSAASRIKGRGG